MRVEFKEFAQKKYAQDYLNSLLKDPKTPLNGFQVMPYAVEPCVVRYLVIANIIEKSDIQEVNVDDLPEGEEVRGSNEQNNKR